ncbi:hemagglutinin/hemolysin-like protein [Candidatus Magnetomorum sp. HK-1]|nr:hemagglutinin/hemolysin-like protein [Candidatus Magnetomorum sp. HK-1]
MNKIFNIKSVVYLFIIIILSTPSILFAYTTQKIYPLDGDDYDEFGLSVSISGNLAIVGAPENVIIEKDLWTGAAYIFQKTDSTWSQAAKLTPLDGDDYDEFGHSVCIFGDYAIVGAPDHVNEGMDIDGAAYIFHYTNSTWSQAAKLTPAHEDPGDYFGYSVAISENYAVVGSDSDSHMVIFERVGNTWTQVYYKETIDRESWVSIWENNVLFSSEDETFFFEKLNNTWTEINNFPLSSTTGSSMYGNYAIVGDSDSFSFEPAYIYQKQASSWSLSATLTAMDFPQDAEREWFGNHVAISENYAMATSDSNSLSEDYGVAYLYKRNGEDWIPTQEFVYPVDEYQYGIDSVAITDEDVILGDSEDYFGDLNTGSVYFIQLYDLSISAIEDQAIMLGSQAVSNDFTIISDSSVIQLNVESSNPNFLTAGAIFFNYSGTSQSGPLTLVGFSGSMMLSLSYDLDNKTRSDSTNITVTIIHQNNNTRSESFGLTAFQLLYVDPVQDDIINFTTQSKSYSLYVQSYFQGMTLTVTSSNTDFIAQESLVLSFNGNSHTSPYTIIFNDIDNSANIALSITPVTDQLGTSTITITAENFFNHTHTQSFNLTKINNSPIITNLSAIEILEDQAIGPIAFTVTDADHPGSLTVTYESSNISLIALENIDISGTSNNYAISLTPTANMNGQISITIAVTDSYLTATTVLSLTVLSVNDMPEISGFSGAYSSAEDMPIGPLTFTISDVDNDPDSLLISVESSSLTLFSADNWALSGTGNSRAITLTPTANLFGETILSISVSDGSLTASSSISITVSSVNDMPVISGILSAYTSTEDTAIEFICFTLTDVDYATENLILSSESSNLTLISLENMFFNGTANSRCLLITPTTNLSGISSITIACSDGKLTATHLFDLFISPVNDMPEISGIESAYTTSEDTAIGASAFTITDIDNDVETLMVSAESSSNTLISDENIQLTDSGNNWNFTITPNKNMYGSTIINISVSDMYLTKTVAFTLFVTPLNDMAIMSDINTSYTTNEDTALGPISLTVTDIDNSPESLIMSFQSSNPELINPENITSSFLENIRTFTITPTSQQSGASMITLAISDGHLTATSSFSLTVVSVNDPPEISGLSLNYSIRKNRTIGPIAFTVSDIDNDDESLIVLSESSSTTLVASENIVISGTSSSRAITITPTTDMYGRTTIIISASDGSLTTTASFTLAVTRESLCPEIYVQYSNYYTAEDTAIEAINFTIFDADDDISYLIVSAESASSTLVLAQNLIMSGTGFSRILSITPTENLYGETVISLSVTDDNMIATAAFTLSVTPVNDIPVISGLDQAYSITEDQTLESVPFSVSDIDLNALNLIVSAQSSSPTLVLSNQISFTGTASSRAIQISPSLNIFGETIITVSVTDGLLTATSAFVFSITPVNDRPEISGFNEAYSIAEDTAIGPINFTITDVDNDSESLFISAESSSPTLIVSDQMIISGTANSHALIITPTSNLFGKTIITLSVTDGFLTTTSAFTLTITPVNDCPEISGLNTGYTISEDTAFGPVDFTITDIEMDANSLIVSAESSSTTVVRSDQIILSGTANSRSIMITPSANVYGQTLILLSVTDGLLTASTSFVLSITPVNDIPEISSFNTEYNTNEDTAIGPISFTFTDIDNDIMSLIVSAMSSSPTLVISEHININGTGHSREMMITPTADLYGETIITVSVTDGILTATSAFTLSVTPVNDMSVISGIDTAYFIEEDTTIGPKAFTITDIDNVTYDLLVSSESSNPTLVSSENMVLSGTGSSRAFHITPTVNGFGETIITISVTDGILTTTSAFTLSVTPVNDMPVISGLNQAYTISEDTDLGPVDFTISDVETESINLIVRSNASHPTLVQANAMVLSGTENVRTLVISPEQHMFGETIITVAVSDGLLTATHAFTLFITPVNDAPEITGLNPKYFSAEDTVLTPIAFTITDLDNDTFNLVLSSESSAMTLVHSDNMVFTGTGNSRAIMITPTHNMFGETSITISVSDGLLTATDTFVLSITPVNDIPKISGINPAYNTAEDTALGPIPFTITDAETEPENLIVSAESSSPTLIISSDIVLSGTGQSRAFMITPVHNMFGESIITISVTDGTLTATSSFTLSVTPVNDIPVISGLSSDYYTLENTVLGPVAFTVTDVDNEAVNLMIFSQSTNITLVQADQILLSGTDISRTLMITPTTNQTGIASIIIAVSDGQLTGTSLLSLDVTPHGRYVQQVITNYEQEKLPSVNDFQVTLIFNTAMNPDIIPQVLLISSSGKSITLNSGGTWTTSVYTNDTYTTPEIALLSEMEGSIQINISKAKTSGNSEMIDYDNAKNFILDVTPPEVPTGLAYNLNANDISFTWNLNTEEDFLGYNLYSNGSKVNTDIITHSSYTNTVESGKEYIFNISAVDQLQNESALSTDLSITSPIAAPTMINPKMNDTVFNNAIFVSGQADSRSTIDIYVDGLKKCSLLSMNSGYFVGNCNNSPLQSGENVISCQQISPYGVKSAFSSEITVNYLQKPGTPKNISTTAGDTVVSFTWEMDDDSDIKGYNIYRKRKVRYYYNFQYYYYQTPFRKINDQFITQKQYTDTCLTNETEYIYQIEAISMQDIASDLSQSISRTPVAGPEWSTE